MSKIDILLSTLAIVAAIILFIIASPRYTKSGTITCYNAGGESYFKDSWRDEIKNNGCTFSYVSSITRKQTTVTGPCVIIEE